MASDSIPIPKDYRFIDKRGRRYGRYTVVEYAGRRGKDHTWLCRCDCGNARVVLGGPLAAGRSRSCGCAKSAAISMAQKTHGATHVNGLKRETVEYSTWIRMKERCYNPKSERYERYGGRGITVCSRWRNSFERFLEDMGPRPSRKHSLDRIRVNGHYEPGNCRWATETEQSRNKGNTLWVMWNGKRVSLAEVIENSGFALSSKVYGAVYRKLKRGWSIERALRFAASS